MNFKSLSLKNENRTHVLQSIAGILVAVLMVKVLISILFEYRNYFPANFNSEFLLGRQATFFGLYRAAFYLHLISGPLAVVLGAAMMLTGGRVRFRTWHRWMGRTLLVIAIGAVVPSGLVMASQAYTGPLAGSGFATLALATGFAALAAMYFARNRNFVAHRRWATRCFILLCSPLLLRVVGGALRVMQIDDDWAYQLNSWLSWSLLLIAFEVWRTTKNTNHTKSIERQIP